MKEINIGIVRQMTETLTIAAVLIALVDIVKATKNPGRSSTNNFRNIFYRLLNVCYYFHFNAILYFQPSDFRCYVGDKRSERWRPCDRSLVIDVGILRFVKDQNAFIYIEI